MKLFILSKCLERVNHEIVFKTKNKFSPKENFCGHVGSGAGKFEPDDLYQQRLFPPLVCRYGHITINIIFHSRIARSEKKLETRS
jgi:hypothetical protein